MPFTIVQTLEGGKKMLTCVPEGWVKNDFLAWPRKKADKLMKVENCVPGADWFLMQCTVKRTGLTYHDAQLAISIMTEITDTEEDESPVNNKQENESKVNINHSDILERCLKKAAVESINNQPLLQPEMENQIIEVPEPTIENVLLEPPYDMFSDKAPSSQHYKTENLSASSTYMEVNENVVSDQQPVEFILYPSQETNTTTSTKNDTIEKLDSLTVTVNAIKNNQKELQETLQQLLISIISMKEQFGEFLRKKQEENLHEEIGFKPINSLDSLQELEDTLKDDRRITELIKKFSFVCGIGKGRGLNNCFALVDVMFDRSFLTTCSWAGGARGEDKKKICFKSFDRVINMFFSVIVQSDNNFTLKECEEFFKNILRNSNRRNSAKKMRSSATKIRIKKNKRAPETPSQNDAAAPKPGPSQNNAAAAAVPEQGQNQNAEVPKQGESQNNAAAAVPEQGQNQNAEVPKQGESQNNAAAAVPEQGQNQNAEVPKQGESETISPEETAQH